MAALFGPSEADLDRLRTTVKSLGTTSVPGLAAALSWRERKAERLLVLELQRPGTPLVYEPGRRVVRWARSLPNAGGSAPVVSASAPPPGAPGAVRVPRAPAPVRIGSGLKTVCPTCHIPLQAAGSADLAVCPRCGRLSSAPSGAPVGVPPPAHPASAGDAGAATSGSTAPTGAPAAASFADRRSQEMFAAWVSAKPIPCPKCRTPLRHRGVSEYVCSSCGNSVRFPTSNGLPPRAA